MSFTILVYDDDENTTQSLRYYFGGPNIYDPYESPEQAINEAWEVFLEDQHKSSENLTLQEKHALLCKMPRYHLLSGFDNLKLSKEEEETFTFTKSQVDEFSILLTSGTVEKVVQHLNKQGLNIAVDVDSIVLVPADSDALREFLQSTKE